MNHREEKAEQDALTWVREVNRRSPFVKFSRADYDDFFVSGLTIALWLRTTLCDPAFTEELYPYGECEDSDIICNDDDYDGF